jgi:hypothetical protein
MGMDEIISTFQERSPKTENPPEIRQLVLTPVDQKDVYLNTGYPQRLDLVLNKSAKSRLVWLGIHIGDH